MSFAPPPDQTKPIIAVVAGATAALVAFFATQDHTPHVGDNIHHLPHGGCYQDGNKRISYGGPRPPTGSFGFSHAWAFITIILVVAAIIVLERRQRRACHVAACNHQ
nr:MAG: putative membrane protein [Yunnan alphaflexivirus]